MQPNPRCCSGPRPKLPPHSTPIHPSIHLSLLLAGSKVLKRPLVRKPMGHPLGLNPAGVLLFRNRALGGVSAAESRVLLRATAKASTPFHTHASIHPSLFAFSYIHGAAQGHGQSFHPIPPPSIHPSIHLSLFAFSWFEGAETALGPQTNWPPLGRESCWGSAVSQPCPRRCFCSRIHGVAQSRGQSFHIPPYSTPIHPSIHLFAFIAGSKVLKRPLVRKPMGHPLGLNPAGVLLFRNRALGGVSAAESTVLHIQVAQCFLWRFRRCSFGS